jgi:hypothetical protein
MILIDYELLQDKTSDQSSSSDCVLTIHHKCKNKRHTTTTTSFEKPVSHSLISSHRSVPIEESTEKNKYILIDTAEKFAHTISRRHSINTQQSKTSDLRNEKLMLPFKLLSSSDNATKHLYEIENPSSFQQSLYETVLLSSSDEQQISRLMNEVARDEHSIIDDYQLASLQDLNQCIVSSHDNRLCMNTDSIPLKKKVTRINHYPNMLADFD